MKTIAIVTARAGSKGLPGKNKKLFAGKPLIEWTFEAALNSKMLDKIIVSTDDWDIIDIAKRCGIEVPFVRPAELAGDDTPHIDVLLHALREVGETRFTHCCLLQPTSPLRIAEDIDHACIISSNNSHCTVVSVNGNYEYPFIVREKWRGGLNHPPSGYLKRQTIQPRYFINGAVFINKIKTLFKERRVYCGNLIPYIMPKERSLQIDDQFDFDLAESVMLKRLKEGKE